MLTPALEDQFVVKLAAGFARSPLQVNSLGRSDAELIRLPGGGCLAVTTDAISEEVTAGLYDDPWLAGWMVVTANLSDLAAVGAEPVGCLVAEILPSTATDEFVTRLQQGIGDAAAAAGTFILGGDTGSGANLHLAGTAVGFCPQGEMLTRSGIRPGDLLYTTGLLGAGNGFVCGKFLGNGPAELSPLYKPVPRLKEGRALHGFASACMDTSDGVMSTLDQLARINGVGFEIDPGWIYSLRREAVSVVRGAGIPAWLLLAGDHGEYELLFTVPSEKERDMLLHASKNGWEPLRLGKALEENVIRMPLDGRFVRIETTRIRNSAFRISGGVRGYIEKLLAIDREMKEGGVYA
jgi:thiamine-monophosphate kinase